MTVVASSPPPPSPPPGVLLTFRCAEEGDVFLGNNVEPLPNIASDQLR